MNFLKKNKTVLKSLATAALLFASVRDVTGQSRHHKRFYRMDEPPANALSLGFTYLGSLFEKNISYNRGHGLTASYTVPLDENGIFRVAAAGGVMLREHNYNSTQSGPSYTFAEIEMKAGPPDIPIGNGDIVIQSGLQFQGHYNSRDDAPLYPNDNFSGRLGAGVRIELNGRALNPYWEKFGLFVENKWFLSTTPGINANNNFIPMGYNANTSITAGLVWKPFSQ